MQAEELIKSTTEELLELLGATGEVTVSENSEEESYDANIETEDVGILIGHHGETIDAIQLIVNQTLFSKLPEEERKRVMVNIGDWRERRKDTLLHLADSLAARALETGEAQPIYDLTPSERRILHVYLEENKEVVTESEGEGRDRHLVVKPR
ncbi:MAG: KH domain-containing protein [bacterium]|nr:KH domain-containing protein [bacterium]